ncbi:MAG TPA: FcoT family thioesterase [Kofleriaceae bacterium]|nr:FcoT family thioesterase [Kofleriaceae bacterium]
MIEPARVPATTIEVSDELIQSILTPYRAECRYLQKLWIDCYDPPGAPTGAVGGSIVGRGQFAIPESFYIVDTGHFNAVEFNLCFNQIGYVYLAYCFDHKLIPPIAEVDLAYYRRQQLGGLLIAKFSSTYRTQMRAARFWGEFSLSKTIERNSLWLLDTRIRYWDDGDGRSEGSALLALLKERPAAG